MYADCESAQLYVDAHVHAVYMLYWNIFTASKNKQTTNQNKNTVKQLLPPKIWSCNGSRLVLVSWAWPPSLPLLLLQAVQLFQYYLALHQTQYQTSRQQNWDWLEEVSSGVLELSWEFQCHLCCPVTVICWECLCS